MSVSAGSWRKRVARDLDGVADRLVEVSGGWPERPAADLPRAAVEEVVAILHDCATELCRPAPKGPA